MGAEQLDPDASHQILGPLKFDNASDQITATLEGIHEDHYEAWKTHLKACQIFDKQCLMWPLSYKYESKGLCGGSGKLSIKYDNYRVVLSNEIATRLTTRLYYSQAEIWYMTYSIVSGLIQYQQLGHKVGDLCTAKILANRQGFLKVVTCLTSPRELVMPPSHELTFPSPQQLQSEQGLFIQAPTTAAESYRLGLTLLQVASLLPSTNLYQSRQFDQERFSHRVKLVSNQYSQSLPQLIRRLTHPRPADRMKMSQLHRTLNLYKEQIRRVEGFTLPLPMLRGEGCPATQRQASLKPPKGILFTIRKQ